MTTILLSFRPGTLSDDQIARIEDAAPGANLIVTRDREEIAAVLDEIEIIAGWGFPYELLPEADHLRWFQQWAAGADWLLRHPAAAEMDFVLTNASGVHPIPIAEHVFGLLLTFARDLHQAVRAQERHEWIHQSEQDALFELYGKRMLLIGVGAIGERIAEVGVALGMDVWGVRRDPTVGAAGVAAMFGPDRLLELLPDVDVVVLTVPLTEETRGMIGERELEAMRPDAYLVNIGRGGTVDEDALIRALREGQLAGAGLDVFEEEPLPEESPLWTMEQVIVTSHYAGITPRYHERALDIFLENLRRYRAGEPLQNVVDKALGY